VWRNGRGRGLRWALVGAVVAAVVVLSLPVVAVVGGNLILGQANSANAVTSLSGSATANLQITNTRAGSPALDLQVVSGAAPLKVNSRARVANLNADRLDGKNASAFLLAGGTAVNSSLLDGRDSSAFAPQGVVCPPGTTVGGYGRLGPFCSVAFEGVIGGGFGSMGSVALAPAERVDPRSPYSKELALVLDPAGSPVVAFLGTEGVSLLHCNDPACAGSDESLQVLGDGYGLSLALDASGLPVILYADFSGNLNLVRCNDANCAGGDESVTVVLTTVVGYTQTALALDGSGSPYFAVTVETGGALMRCWEPDCASGPSLLANLSSGYSPSLLMDPHGYPVVAYRAGLDQVRVLYCGSQFCNQPGSGWFSKSDVTFDTVEGEYVSLALDWAGNPVLAYDDATLGRLKVAHCNDRRCTGGDESLQVVDSGTDVGRFASLQLDDNGWPVVAYVGAIPGDFYLYLGPAAEGLDPRPSGNTLHPTLKLAHCNDPKCAGGDEYLLMVEYPMDAASGLLVPNIGYWASLTLDRAGHPVIAYLDLTDAPALRLAAYVG
jgi:hypothetical protein